MNKKFLKTTLHRWKKNYDLQPTTCNELCNISIKLQRQTLGKAEERKILRKSKRKINRRKQEDKEALSPYDIYTWVYVGLEMQNHRAAAAGAAEGTKRRAFREHRGVCGLQAGMAVGGGQTNSLALPAAPLACSSNFHTDDYTHTHWGKSPPPTPTARSVRANNAICMMMLSLPPTAIIDVNLDKNNTANARWNFSPISIKRFLPSELFQMRFVGLRLFFTSWGNIDPLFLRKKKILEHRS